MQNSKKIAAFAAVYVIWGSTYLAIRYAIETIPPFLMMGVRSILAGLLLYLWSSRDGLKISRQEWKSLVIVSFLFFACGHGLLAWAQKSVASGLAAVLIASDPLWIALIESFTVKQFHLSKKQIAGLVIGFAGMILLFLSPGDAAVGGINLFGAIMILISAITWSVGAVYSRVAKLPKAATAVAGLELIIGGLFLMMVAVLIGETTDFSIRDISLRSGLALIYLIVFGSIVAFTAYVWLLKITSATSVATHTYVNPLIALFLGTVVADERFTLTMLGACGVIVVSVYLVLQKSESRSPKGRSSTSGSDI
jgi:drug/metabolite transporter (DMT)-like permease